MPQPERVVDPHHHPRWTRNPAGLGAEGAGMRIFRNAVSALA
jgi:phosphoribosylformylglycinamidine synthase